MVGVGIGVLAKQIAELRYTQNVLMKGVGIGIEFRVLTRQIAELQFLGYAPLNFRFSHRH